jgi:hypothetical protein
MYIAHYIGGKYVYDKVQVELFNKCVFYVKNTDDNCLYAALFSAYAKHYGKFMLNGKEHEFSSD